MLESLFRYILDLSLAGSIGIVLIVILRLTVIKNHSYSLKYYLWLFVIVKLTIPINIPVHIHTVLYSKIPLASSATHPNMFAFTDSSYIVTDTAMITNSSKYFNYESLFIILWIIGVLFLFAYHTYIYLNFLNKIKDVSEDISDDRIITVYKQLLYNSNIKMKISLKYCEGIISPLGIGIFNKCILIPKDTYTAEELHWILMHELTHFKRHDLAYKILTLIIQDIYWFNPLMYLMRYIINSDCELSCDETSLNGCDMQSRKLYATTFVHSLKRTRNKMFKSGLIIGFNTNKSILKRRVDNMLNLKRNRNGIILVVLALVIVVGSFIKITALAETTQTKEVGSVNTNQTISKPVTDTINIDKKDEKESTSTNPETTLTSDELKKITINTQYIRGDSDVKNNTPYKIKYPSSKMEGLTLVDKTLDIHNYKNAPVHIVELDYKGNNNEVLYIQQVDSTDTNPAAAESTEGVTLSDGTQARVYDPLKGKGAIHIIFSTDGNSYDVEGFNLGKDRLIKIADSLN